MNGAFTENPLSGGAECYIASPCAASSLPFWKAKAFKVPENMLVIRDDEFRRELYPDYTDEPYFKLVHRLEGLEKPVLDEGFVIVSKSFAQYAEHIKACYGGGPSEAELLAMTERDVYAPELWLAIAQRDTGIIAASGIGELDRSIGEGVLEWIQVSEAFRRRGLGRFIVRELLLRMRDEASFVTVSGMVNNPSDPLSLYTSCGFLEKTVWHVLKRK